MDLTEYRRELDELDAKLLDLFLTRLAICADIARYKQAHSLPVYDPAVDLHRFAGWRPPPRTDTSRPCRTLPRQF